MISIKPLQNILRRLGPQKIVSEAISLKNLKYFRYPLSACELLSSDNSQTIDFYFGDNPIIIRQEIVDTTEPPKEGNESQAAVKEEKPKTAEKVVIKDKLEGEESNTQAPTTEPKI